MFGQRTTDPSIPSLQGLTPEMAEIKLRELGYTESRAQLIIQDYFDRLIRGGMNNEEVLEALSANRRFYLGKPDTTCLWLGCYEQLDIPFPDNSSVDKMRFSSNMRDRTAHLEIGTRDYFTYCHLQDLLLPEGQRLNPNRAMYHDHFSQLNRRELLNYPASCSGVISTFAFKIYFNLSRYSKAFEPDDIQSILHVLHNIFEILEKDNNQSYSFQHSRAITFIAKYNAHHRADFPGGNYYLRYSFDPNKYRFSTKEKVESLQERLFEALVRSNCSAEKVLSLFRQGMSPNIRFETEEMVFMVLPSLDYTDNRSPELLRRILRLFTEYAPQLPGCSILSELITRACVFGLPGASRLNVEQASHWYGNETRYRTCLGMIYDLMATAGPEFFSDGFRIPATLRKNPAVISLIQLIENGIGFINREKGKFLPSIIRTYTNNSQQRNLSFSMQDGTTITVHTIQLSQIINNLEILKQLYKICKRNFQWQDRMNKAEFKIYIYKILENDEPNSFIDIIRIGEKICGFNIAKFRWAKRTIYRLFYII